MLALKSAKFLWRGNVPLRGSFLRLKDCALPEGSFRQEINQKCSENEDYYERLTERLDGRAPASCVGVNGEEQSAEHEDYPRYSRDAEPGYEEYLRYQKPHADDEDEQTDPTFQQLP